MTLQASVSISWVNTVLAAAEQQGVAREALLAQAGIAAHELNAERWPIDHITRLWCAAARYTQDAGFGLKVGASVGPASFNVVSFLLQSAPTLREAFALVQQCQSLISDGGRFQTIAGADACWVVYHPSQGELAFSPQQIEAVKKAYKVYGAKVPEGKSYTMDHSSFIYYMGLGGRPLAMFKTSDNAERIAKTIPTLDGLD